VLLVVVLSGKDSRKHVVVKEGIAIVEISTQSADIVRV